jgi:hypothetical protein
VPSGVSQSTTPPWASRLSAQRSGSCRVSAPMSVQNSSYHRAISLPEHGAPAHELRARRCPKRPWCPAAVEVADPVRVVIGRGMPLGMALLGDLAGGVAFRSLTSRTDQAGSVAHHANFAARRQKPGPPWTRRWCVRCSSFTCLSPRVAARRALLRGAIEAQGALDRAAGTGTGTVLRDKGGPMAHWKRSAISGTGACRPRAGRRAQEQPGPPQVRNHHPRH